MHNLLAPTHLGLLLQECACDEVLVRTGTTNFRSTVVSSERFAQPTKAVTSVMFVAAPWKSQLCWSHACSGVPAAMQ